ncbi:hypothetical protein GCM10017044_12640 [Kordiimonas sediminis]|uniref:Uncharacterized protein n=1 Tax=Kordiimonas sediminis TaxID=1735581 RepID=A0A919AQM1_9PROT|nr:hypothetical protein [Kordiimonas sediminis]GHF19458.1 hypothetical protein GCM10017044_12640 [Kordiimonas sediminis]
MSDTALSEFDTYRLNKPESRIPQDSTVQTDAASEFIVRVTRAWVGALNARREHGAAKDLHKNVDIWNRSFCTVGGIPASRAWDMFLACLCRKSERQIMLGCACCGKISEDELTILLSLLHLREGRAQDAFDLYKQWLKPDDARVALSCAIEFFDQLSRYGAYVNRSILAALMDDSYRSRRQMH